MDVSITSMVKYIRLGYKKMLGGIVMEDYILSCSSTADMTNGYYSSRIFITLTVHILLMDRYMMKVKVRERAHRFLRREERNGIN